MKKISIVIMACSMGVAAQAQLIDNFSDTDLSQYTKSVVLEQSALNAVSFASPLGALQVSKAADSGAEQVLFLRGDYSLSVGSILQVDTSVYTNAGLYSDFGIAVSANVDPDDAVWTSGTADVRTNYITIYVKGQYGTLGYVGFDDHANVGSSSGYNIGGITDLLGLYISRPTANDFDLGYIKAGGNTTIKHFTMTNSVIGTAVGFFADLRATTTYGDLDNLRLVPEPASFALLGLGALAAICGLRRRK